MNGGRESILFLVHDMFVWIMDHKELDEKKSSWFLF